MGPLGNAAFPLKPRHFFPKAFPRLRPRPVEEANQPLWRKGFTLFY